MRYMVLATDYDGTLALDERLDKPTIAALLRLRASGRRLVMVTGRELDDLKRVCHRLDLFDLVVAENGALIYTPADDGERPLGEAPAAALVSAMAARGVAPISVGRVIVATWEPHQQATLEVIRTLGLELQVIFNKGAVMVLPSGINKASGLQAALAQLGLSAHNVVGIGDAENDHAFLNACECGVAVSNALPMLRERADWVTPADHGAGVAQLIDALLEDDLASLEPRLQRHQITIGTDAQGVERRIAPYGTNVLLVGSSGSGKSTLATALLDQLTASDYQFCIIDPEGDYDTFPSAAVLGSPDREPTIDEILQVLATPSQNVVVNLIGLTLDRRPTFFDQLLPRLEDLRGRAGRPHWIVVDEAHHMLHADRIASPPRAADGGMLYITVHPDLMTPAVLADIQYVIAIGDAPAEALRSFARTAGTASMAEAIDVSTLAAAPSTIEAGAALLWDVRAGSPPAVLRAVQPTSEHQRHVRKYAAGDMQENAFVFRGQDDKLSLRAQNLTIFLLMADGVDDATWQFHLARGDYAAWFGGPVKDAALAEAARAIAAEAGGDARQSRAKIRKAIESRYTAPAA